MNIYYKYILTQSIKYFDIFLPCNYWSWYFSCPSIW